MDTMTAAWIDRIEELERALRPFAEFAVQGTWVGTPWEHRNSPVLHCHGTKREVMRNDFEYARQIYLKSKRDGQ